MLRFTASKLLNRSLALLKGAFLYITGVCGSVYSQTCKIGLLVLFLLFGFTNRNCLQIFCPLNIRFYFFLHFFVCSFFFCFRNHFFNFFVRHAKRICQANSFCLICSQFIFCRTLIQSYNQFYNNIFHLRKNISTI